jgi:hypothetical protein
MLLLPNFMTSSFFKGKLIFFTLSELLWGSLTVAMVMCSAVSRCGEQHDVHGHVPPCLHPELAPGNLHVTLPVSSQPSYSKDHSQ